MDEFESIGLSPEDAKKMNDITDNLYRVGIINPHQDLADLIRQMMPRPQIVDSFYTPKWKGKKFK